jgi:hypothetical protein
VTLNLPTGGFFCIWTVEMDSKNNLYVYRGIARKLHVYVDKDSKKKATIDFTNWLDGDNIASITYEVEDSSTVVQVTDTSETTKIATLYLACTDYNSTPIHVKAKMVTDAAIPETCSRSIVVHRVRTT